MTNQNVFSLPVFQESKISMMDLPAILILLRHHEKKETDALNYIKADKIKSIFDLITNNKIELDRSIRAENKAILERDCKEALLMKTQQKVIKKEITRILIMIASEIPLKLCFSTPSISAGDCHSIVLSSDGNVVCWGMNDNKQCDVPEIIQGNVAMISAGSCHSIALTNDGKVNCWGMNYYKQCDIPEIIQGYTIMISAGSQHSIALTSDRKVTCWGINTYKQCDVPEIIQGCTKMISAGGQNSIALTNDGKVICWGNNDRLQCS